MQVFTNPSLVKYNPKKSEKADLENKRGIFMQAGLVISLTITLIAFEWRSNGDSDFAFENTQSEDIPEEIIPITRQEEQPPPPPPVMQLIVVKDDFVIENEAEVAETEVTEETVIEIQPVKEQVINEPEIFLHAEEMPSFPGGESELFKFLAQNIRYPGTALESGTQGMVMLSFVVDPEGKIKNVEVLKGIGNGCDEEAIRVVLDMPRWKPGKQRGKPVSVRYSIPVRFVLR